MPDSPIASEQRFASWQILVVAIASSLIGLVAGGIIKVLGEPHHLTGGAVALGATVITLFALAEVDAVMKEDRWLRMARASTTIVAAWTTVGAALAEGLPDVWAWACGGIFAAYVVRRTIVS